MAPDPSPRCTIKDKQQETQLSDFQQGQFFKLGGGTVILKDFQNLISKYPENSPLSLKSDLFEETGGLKRIQRSLPT